MKYKVYITCEVVTMVTIDDADSNAIESAVNQVALDLDNLGYNSDDLEGEISHYDNNGNTCVSVRGEVKTDIDVDTKYLSQAKTIAKAQAEEELNSIGCDFNDMEAVCYNDSDNPEWFN